MLSYQTNQTLLYRSASQLSRGEVFGRIGRLAAELPDHRYAINLATGRGAFMAGFLAVLQRHQINLLPPSRAPGLVRQLQSQFPDSYILADETCPELDGWQHCFDLDRLVAPADAPLWERPPQPNQLAAITFTSGSTGGIKANRKYWRSLTTGARLAARRFELGPDVGIIATVPPQHMYGLETSIFYPLIIGCAVHEERPMFPADVAAAIAAVTSPRRLLVTTPIHLRSFVEAQVGWPKIDLVISATAPLTRALAAAAEQRLGAPVREIYGCTEAGSLASRRTTEDDCWTMYDGVRLVRAGSSPIVAGGHVDRPTRLSDILDGLDERRFRLLGRDADHVSIAGKRASLGDLNAKLLAIEGIQDGAFIAPDALDGAKAERLAALYVSEQLDERAVLAGLKRQLDPVFLPRPIRRVARLPRNELGKLPRQRLLELLHGTAGADAAEAARAAHSAGG